jgi:predicted HicB family RNase H-like nuclease
LPRSQRKTKRLSILSELDNIFCRKSHKGYTARVEYDERDNILVGRLLGIRSIISFHAETVAELRLEFETAVEDYLAECKEAGLKPEKPASGKILLRVPPEVHGKALVAAQASGKSLNQWASEILQSAVHADGF